MQVKRLPRDFERFGHADAWALGSPMVATASAQGYPVGIAINIDALQAFRG